MKQQEIIINSTPLLSVLLLIFVVLKLTGEVTWPWFWITSPIWAPFAVTAIVIAVMAVAVLFGLLIKAVLLPLKLIDFIREIKRRPF